MNTEPMNPTTEMNQDKIETKVSKIDNLPLHLFTANDETKIVMGNYAIINQTFKNEKEANDYIKDNQAEIAINTIITIMQINDDMLAQRAKKETNLHKVKDQD